MMNEAQTSNRNPFSRSQSGFTTGRHVRPTTAVRRQILVDEHADLVRVVARQVGRSSNLTRCSMDEDDLFSVGIIGLFDAEERFDPHAGTPFPTFAEFRIKGAMLDELRRRDVMPRRLRTKASKLRKTEQKLARELGEPAEQRAIAEDLGWTLGKLAAVRRQMEAFKFVPAESGIAISSDAPRPDKVAEKKERAERLAAALEQLPERDQLVLDLYFTRDHTLSEIGEILGVTEGRVSQIKSAATRKLRELLQTD